jgi:hypothetical protein
MKKLIVLSAALAAMAIAPSSAFAVSGWAGWDSQHSDNLASPGYYPPSGSFGKNGPGNSRYCVDPSTALTSTSCGTSVTSGGTAVYSPVVFTGVLAGTSVPPADNQGCGHDDGSYTGASDPCSTSSTNMVGAAYIGTSETGSDGTQVSSTPCYTETPEAGSEGSGGTEGYNPYAGTVPNVGCGVQG